jgi:7-cyano-7-deazaguanine synthase
MAVEDVGVGLALTFDYGQKAAERETAAAKAIAARFDVPHRVVALPWLGEITTSAIVRGGGEVPCPEEKDLEGPAARELARNVWCPNRNGIFINIAAAFAEAMDVRYVVAGFNAEEAKSFPDNSPEFVAAASGSLALSTWRRVEILNPIGVLTKGEILERALASGAPLNLIWSCYLGGREHCGRCESCRRLFRALRGAGLLDRFRRGRPKRGDP